MKNTIDNDEKAQLKILGYRKDPKAIELCVSRLAQGEKPWQLYEGNDAIVSQELGRKIGRDYADGKLDFIRSYHVDNILKSRLDPFRATRYHIVKQAEKMAPHKRWNIQHMRSIKIGDDEARKLLTEYDQIRIHREKAEITLDSWVDGEKIQPTKKVMARFRTLRRYLVMLYAMYYQTTYPEAPSLWAARASEVRADGELNSDQHLVEAGDDAMRYQVWEFTKQDATGVVMKNLDTYFNSLARLKRTRGSHQKFVKDLKKRFGLKGNDYE
jgi:hypothetical protein